MLDVTIWRQRESLTVHMVNLTNSMTMKGSIREFIPSPPQEATTRVPAKPKRVHLLVSAHQPAVREAAGEVTLTVPSILDHEVIAIDL